MESRRLLERSDTVEVLIIFLLLLLISMSSTVGTVSDSQFKLGTSPQSNRKEELGGSRMGLHHVPVPRKENKQWTIKI